MRGVCVGYARVDRKRQDGSKVAGYNVWVTKKGIESLVGEAFQELWISDTIIAGVLDLEPKVGQKYMWSLNQWGRVDDWDICD